MNIVNYAAQEQVPGLRKLWKAAFGDDDEFLDKFFSTAFAPHRCRCVTEGTEILAALYWFDTSCAGQKFAYLYAVATDPAHRGQGLCRLLLEDTLHALRHRGYQGALLVPGDEGLARMYEKLGFTPCTQVSEFCCAPEIPAAPIHKIDAAAYAQARALLLPRGSIIQEGENLAFLDQIARFYEGPGFLAAVSADGERLHCHELLGDITAAPRMLSALGLSFGCFRCPGTGRDFAMLYPLTPQCLRPGYFGLAFD